MVDRFSKSDISFKEMTEEEAVSVFVEDGYYDYVKRKVRYGKYLPPDSIWATAPAKMFVGFLEGKPVGVIGFTPYKGVLLSAGAHIRRNRRGKGLLEQFVKKILQEKGNKTLFINLANPKISRKYRSLGFKDMNKDELPNEIQEELQGIDYPEQLQKWVKLDPSKWMEVLKWN